MTMRKVKRELIVSSIFEFWDYEMTDDEKKEFMSGVEPSTDLPDVYGSDADGIAHVLMKRKELYHFTYDDRRDGYFIIWEFE